MQTMGRPLPLGPLQEQTATGACAETTCMNLGQGSAAPKCHSRCIQGQTAVRHLSTRTHRHRGWRKTDACEALPCACVRGRPPLGSGSRSPEKNLCSWGALRMLRILFPGKAAVVFMTMFRVNGVFLWVSSAQNEQTRLRTQSGCHVFSCYTYIGIDVLRLSIQFTLTLTFKKSIVIKKTCIHIV